MNEVTVDRKRKIAYVITFIALLFLLLGFRYFPNHDTMIIVTVLFLIVLNDKIASLILKMWKKMTKKCKTLLQNFKMNNKNILLTID